MSTRMATVVLIMSAWLVSLFGVMMLGIAVGTVNSDCAQEDSFNCTWRADTRSNGEGTSFTTVSLFGDRLFFQIER